MPADLPPSELTIEALASLCRTARGRRATALIYRAEDHLTPAEYDALLALLPPDDFPHDFIEARRQEWQAGLAATGGVPEVYRRTAVSSAAQLYQGTGGPRDLVILLPGLHARFGTPTPMLLQAFRAADVDVLLLSDPAREDYRLGVPGLADDLPGLVRALTRVAPGPYRRRIAMGHSKGGAAALRLAVLSGGVIDAAIAFAPRASNDALRIVAGIRPPPAFDPLCSCLADRPLTARTIHAARHGEDRAEALAMSARQGVHSVGIAWSNSHNIPNRLRRGGDLRPFLDALLADLAGPPRLRRYVLREHGPAPIVRKVLRAVSDRLGLTRRVRLPYLD